MDAQVRMVDGGIELVDGDRLLARGHVSDTDRHRDIRIDLVVAADRSAAFEAMLPPLLSLADDGSGGPGPVRWWVTDPDTATDHLADLHGLLGRRDLHQLRRPLPLDTEVRGDRPAVPTRPIRLGTDDEDAVVAVNNRAFAWHPDQAGRTKEWIHRYATEPWFDAAGFLVHETDGTIDGFCWTKVHDDVQPAVGEIFVIGVDPSAHGRGLGRGLTVAGLDHLTGRGVGTAMLYVEASNVAGHSLYGSLGFRLHQLNRAYQPVPNTAGSGDADAHQ